MDFHTDDMIILLRGLGHEPIRLHPQELPTKGRTAFSLGGAQWDGSIRTQQRTIDLSAVRSVWWRRPSAYQIPPDLSAQERAFAKLEWEHALRGMWAALDCYWVSHPDHIRVASWKVEQLQRAAALGFEVPRTVITNDPDHARAFYDACHGRMIYKVLSDPSLALDSVAKEYDPNLPPPPRGTGTTMITETELALLETICLAPCQFQEYVPKQVELRVTVIGDQIFAAEIHSQAHERTSIDWRHYDVKIPYRRAELPRDVADRCLALVKSYQLNFSAIDLILTPDGRYIFLENNPNGQFIFIERLVPELQMTKALAECLIRGANSLS